MEVDLNLNQKIDWLDSRSHLLLNTKLSDHEKNQLIELYKLNFRPHHIWIASSGSSKKANESLKLIALDKKAFLASSQAVNEHLLVGKNDKWIQVLSRFHVGGLSLESRAYLSKIPVVDGLQTEKWDPAFFVKTAELEKATLTSMVPTQIYDLLQAELKCPSSLRAIVVGGAPMSRELYVRAREAGWPALASFGMTECASQVATAELKSLDTKLGEFPLYKVLNHCEVDLNEDGFLKIKSKSLFTGYAQLIGGKSKWIEPEITGWFTTQDKSEILRTQGGVFLVGASRETEFIKIKGEGVSLAKLREILDGVLIKYYPAQAKEVTLTAKQDSSRDGAVLQLVHSKKVSVDEAEHILETFNKQVSSIERLVKVKQVEEIPRSALGKILYSNLN